MTQLPDYTAPSKVKRNRHKKIGIAPTWSEAACFAA
jgi:hypothetical protein